MIVSNYLFRTRYLSPFSTLEIKKLRYQDYQGGVNEKILIFSGEYNKILLMDAGLRKVEQSKHFKTDIFETFE